MEKIDDSQSASSLKDWQTGLDPDLSGAGSSVVISLCWVLTLILTEGSHHLKLSRLILIKVINSQMHAIWRDKGMFNITEQRLMKQQSQSINQSINLKLDCTKH